MLSERKIKNTQEIEIEKNKIKEMPTCFCLEEPIFLFEK